MALFNARLVNLNSVNGILADFKEKVQQLNDLATRQEKIIDTNKEAIERLYVDSEQRIVEAKRARDAADKINSFFN